MKKKLQLDRCKHLLQFADQFADDLATEYSTISMVSNNLIQYIIVFHCILHCYICEDISKDNQSTTVFCVALYHSNDLEHQCEGHNFTEYHTLAYYMTHHYKYFRSYQKYVFASGYHNPPDNVTVPINNVTNLTLVGAELDQTNSRTAVVNCNSKSVVFEII